jgi:hypothetical protein
LCSTLQIKLTGATLNEKAVLNHPQNTDHSPDGISWIDPDEWQEWDGTIYNPEEHSRQDFAALICQGSTIRGLRTLFYDNAPFADNVNPTKAEVDNWHTIAVHHVRAMVGYTGPDYTIKPDQCLHIRALWSDERQKTRMWDTDYPGSTCEGSSNPHCGAGFIPSVADQQPYLPDGIESCGSRAGSEGLFSAAKSNIPWSIRWARPFCATLGGEGFWGGHTGPWFHRTEFGWSWSDSEPLNSNSNAGLRTKWSGKSGLSKYVNPDISSGKFTVNVEGEDPNPRFSGIQCQDIAWSEKADNATACYKRMIGDPSCGKKFMTYNTGDNNGCACYPPSVTICEVNYQSSRQTWDFDPVVSSFDGVLVDTNKVLTQNALPYVGRECPNINWKPEAKAGDPSDCLQKIIEGNFADCGRKFITWNSANGGCACYPPGQESCTKDETLSRSGRQTYELEVDPSYSPPTPTTSPPTPAPNPSGGCVNSPLPMLMNKKSKQCKWVARGNTTKRCNKKNVRDHCPDTCAGDCSADSQKKFKLQNGNAFKCTWVANKNTSKRCSKDGVSETCRNTCRSALTQDGSA